MQNALKVKFKEEGRKDNWRRITGNALLGSQYE